MTTPPPGPLLSTRAALILLLAFVTGLLAAVLAHLTGDSLPAAALYGTGAAGGALLLFHTIIGQ
jgi:hypothetical protein